MTGRENDHFQCTSLCGLQQDRKGHLTSHIRPGYKGTSMARPEELRIGGVPYQVGAPLLTGLGDRPGVRLDRIPPRLMVEPLRRGELDAALLSSIEAFRTDGYSAMPDLGIACEGKVRSVRLFLRTPPERVRTLALDNGSATSVVLSRLLLERRHGAQIERSFTISPMRQPDAIDADAVLLIGDAGMAADPGGRHVLDLGEEWHAWKGLPFVFAMWLLPKRDDVVATGERPHEDARVERIANELRAAWRRGKSQGVQDGTGGLIRYELGPAEIEGLLAFRDEALALGLCCPGVEPRWIGAHNVR